MSTFVGLAYGFADICSGVIFRAVLVSANFSAIFSQAFYFSVVKIEQTGLVG